MSAFEKDFTTRLFADVRAGRIDGITLGSLINDLGYAKRIVRNLQHVLMLGEGDQGQRWLTSDDELVVVE